MRVSSPRGRLGLGAKGRGRSGSSSSRALCSREGQPSTPPGGHAFPLPLGAGERDLGEGTVSQREIAPRSVAFLGNGSVWRFSSRETQIIFGARPALIPIDICRARRILGLRIIAQHSTKHQWVAIALRKQGDHTCYMCMGTCHSPFPARAATIAMTLH